MSSIVNNVITNNIKQNTCIFSFLNYKLFFRKFILVPPNLKKNISFSLLTYTLEFDP